MNPILDPAEYAVEIWDINGVMIADVSDIIATQLNIELKLNDIESVEFSLDLVQFELLCAEIGATASVVLEPYRTDVRIRRNGVYLCGVQVVRTETTFNNQETNKIQVQCTGYLNYFRDRYITANYADMTYAQIARQLITDTQAQTNGNFGVTLGVDLASASQQADRVRNYDLQNVKDGIINLTKLENDNFDFDFTADKVFNIYDRIGTDRPEVRLVYPQNITSLRVPRDASTLANRIIGIGSGMGEERLQTEAIGTNSSIAYRIRERIELFNSVEDLNVLVENVEGKLLEYQFIYQVPSIAVTPNELDINTVRVGDAIFIEVDGSTYIDNVSGMFRITKISISVDVDGKEQIALEVLPW